MKQLIFILAALAFVAISCGNPGQKRDNGSQGNGQVTAVGEALVFDADTLYAVAETLIDKPVIVRGYVTHVCEHSGKRCFLTGEEQVNSIRVEATGDISGFDQELKGSLLEVSGILREQRLTGSQITDMEASVNKMMKEEEGSAEACEAELANINQMREWMEARGKDFYAIYFIDGLNYEVVNN